MKTKHKRVASAAAFGFAAAGLAACSITTIHRTEVKPPVQEAPYDLGGVDPELAVEPTQVMVLGTAHLRAFEDTLTPADLAPLLDRLEAFAPDAITMEQDSVMTCQRAEAFPREHHGACSDLSAFQAESGISRADGSFALAKAGRDAGPSTPAAHRSRAAAFLAAGDPYSALVQWLQLAPAERRKGDGLGPASVMELQERAASINEISSVSAPVAARLGHARLYPADDHGTFYRTDAEWDAYEARKQALWPQKGEGGPCAAMYDYGVQPFLDGDVLEGLRLLNSVERQRLAIDCDFRRNMNDGQPEGYGRQYVHSWEARNLRMAAYIMDAAQRHPGGRLLVVVGANHKAHLEDYLGRMHDVEIVNTDTVLAR